MVERRAGQPTSRICGPFHPHPPWAYVVYNGIGYIYNYYFNYQSYRKPFASSSPTLIKIYTFYLTLVSIGLCVVVDGIPAFQRCGSNSIPSGVREFNLTLEQGEYSLSVLCPLLYLARTQTFLLTADSETSALVLFSSDNVHSMVPPIGI